LIRKIIHVDMDAFFASVEQRDHPDLRGRPVIVGGDPEKRGVVATCSYEARKYGVRSAMPTSRARILCPEAIFIKPRFSVYISISHQIRDIFFRYTELVEPLSLDEAYLDVTKNKAEEVSATRLAQKIKKNIFEETGLTASAGVSFNKFLAKIASGWSKPNGLTVVPPEQAQAFVEKLPIRQFFGIGKVTEQKMLAMGIRTGADLRRRGLQELVSRFGKSGAFFYNMAHCQDDRAVNPHRVRKSIGKEVTLQEDICAVEEMEVILKQLARSVSELLKKRKVFARTVTLKARYGDFTTVTRSHTLRTPIQDPESIFQQAVSLLSRTKARETDVRLLGISTSNFLDENRFYSFP